MNKQERVIKLIEELESVFQIRVFLDHDPYKVLVRTILSQRTRDENTDQATNNLFEKYPDIYAVVDAPIDDVKELIRPAGFYNVKAARIQEVSQILIDEYGGEVPDTVDELVKLPGVGRKTATNRLGLVDTKNPEDTEVELCKIAPEDLWIKLNDLMVQFGQNICKPLSPQCEICPCCDICDYFSENVH